MLYLISEIVVSLALASVLGVGIGWWIRATRSSAKNGDRDKELRRANSDVAKLEAKLREVGPQSMVLEPRIAELEAQNAELESSLDRLKQASAADREELEEKAAEMGRLQVSLEESTKAGEGVAPLEAQVLELAQRAEAAEAGAASFQSQVAELVQRAESAETGASETTNELSGLRESLSRANGEAENRAERLLAAQSRVAELQRELFARDASVSVLRERSDKMRADALDSSSLTEELERAREAHQASMDELEQLQTVHADCDFAFSTLRDQIVALRRRVSEVESGAAPKPRLAVAKKNGTTGTVVSRGGAVAALATQPHRPEWLLEAPSRLPDDLKQVNGIGLRLEKKLNELGIYYFQQIAAMTPDDAVWLDDQLEEFRGKLYRDDWIDQARDLVEGRQHVKEY